MPALPRMPELAPFMPAEARNEMVEKGLHFWISAIVERTGTDPKGDPKQELVYTIFCPEIIDGPCAFSLGATSYRQAQADLVRAELPNGTVGPCILRKLTPTPGQTLYSIEPVEEEIFENPAPAAAKRSEAGRK